MIKIKDILKLRKDIVFGGAVQTDWYYDEKSKIIAENFVFHGPDFFGVTVDDVEFKNHKLMDTCSYTALLADRLYKDDGNPIILTIAGYGTGKSHLCVALGKLFSQNANDEIAQKVIFNIKKINDEIGKEIEGKIDKPNLVLVLNGMNDFNLNYEILNSAKKVLNQWGYDDELFSEFTKAYNIAYRFLNNNFEVFENKFKRATQNHGISSGSLKEYMIQNIYTDSVFDSINEVYKEIIGEYIRWDEGVSAAEVLSKLVDKLCNEKGPFNKILILFDEFGRYIEYASAYPSRAGDSALQQIFEAIQDSNNKIILNAFIQSDLKTYLSRVNKTSNISRYIGRYEAGEKIYISSNLETIFANLIDKYDRKLFNDYISGYFKKEATELNNEKTFKGINMWVNSSNRKGIWSNYEKYKEVVLIGIYPLNPIATWLITSLSDWYQQRSALNFLIKSFDNIRENNIYELGDLPEIKAIDIIKGDLFQELLLAETEGRQKSEYCTVYDKILIKYSDKLKSIEKDVIAGILVLKLCKFRNKSYDDLLYALVSTTGIKEEILKIGLSELEDTYGIIGYDEKNYTFDFIEDSAGKNDFLRLIRKKKQDLKVNLDILFNSDIMDKLEIREPLATDFDKKNFIKTSEWVYTRELLPASNINELYISNLIKDIRGCTTPDRAKGRLIYIYNNQEQGIEYVNSIVNMYENFSIEKYPIIMVLLDDKEDNLYEALIDDRISKCFTEEEIIKFFKYIKNYKVANDEKIKECFKNMVLERLYVDESGIGRKEMRIGMVCSKKFEELYTDTIPFDFQGFNNKIISVPKKIHSNIARMIIQNSLNYQTISAQNSDVVNRIKSVLENNRSGWGVLSTKTQKNINLTSPTNIKVKKLFDKLDIDFYNRGFIDFKELINNFTKPPYGLNDYSASLLIAVYISTKFYEAKIQIDNVIINNVEWATQVFTEKTLNYEKINRSKLIKINIEGYKLAFQAICVKIDKNKDIDVCPDLSIELEKLLKESNPPEEFIEKLEGCKLILEEGLRLYSKITQSIARLQGKLERGIENEAFDDILTVVNETDEITESIEGNSRYAYNENHIAKFMEINKDGRIFIERKYEIFISKVQCNGVGQASSFEKWMKFMKDQLNKIGYQHLANKTNSRMLEVLDNLNLIRERQNVKQSIDVFLNKQVSKFTSQEDLITIIKDGKNLLKNLEGNNKLDKKNKLELSEEVTNAIDKADELLSEISGKLTKIYDEAYEIKTIEGAKEILSDIQYLLSKKLREDDKKDIEVIGNILQNFVNDINHVSSTIDVVEKLELAKNIKLKYSEEEEVQLVDAMINYINIVENDINIKEEVWRKQNLNYATGEILIWDSNKCYSWLEQTNVLPRYLSNDIVLVYEKIKAVVLDRTIQLKIDSILFIFNQLTKEEKEHCVRILQHI